MSTETQATRLKWILAAHLVNAFLALGVLGFYSSILWKIYQHG